MIKTITQSLSANKNGIILMIFSSVCVAVGQLFWKLSFGEGFLLLIPGFILYGIGAILMIIAYRFGSLSTLQPILSLSYVYAILMGNYVLEENIGVYKILGIIAISIGVFFLCAGERKK